jgi:hypothetical protein
VATLKTPVTDRLLIVRQGVGPTGLFLTTYEGKKMARATKNYPDLVRQHFGTRKQFHAQKKREFKAVKKAFGELRLACAYLPKDTYLAFNQVEKALRILEAEMKKV